MVAEFRVGDFGQRRFPPEGDTKPRLLDHQPVVGAIADGHDVIGAEPEFVADFDERIALTLGVEHRSEGKVGTLSLADFTARINQEVTDKK